MPLLQYADVHNDQWGGSHFNWTLASGTNYHILRTGCWPYMKYHCTQRPHADLSWDNRFFRALKVMNLGLPLLVYGLYASQLITHTEMVRMEDGREVTIYFLYKEDKGARY